MCGHRSGVDFLLEVISSGVLGGSNLHFRGSERQQIPRLARNDNIGGNDNLVELRRCNIL
jgi:hypothetical protein